MVVWWQREREKTLLFLFRITSSVRLQCFSCRSFNFLYFIPNRATPQTDRGRFDGRLNSAYSIKIGLGWKIWNMNTCIWPSVIDVTSIPSLNEACVSDTSLWL